MIIIDNFINMITSLSDEVGKVNRRGKVRDFEMAFRQLDEFVDVNMLEVRK